MPDFKSIGTEIGELVQQKNLAYGDSFAKSGEILAILYPDGVRPDQYQDLLAVTRILDKLFRIATDRDALGESPYRDICGYALLGIASHQATTANMIPVDDPDALDQYRAVLANIRATSSPKETT